MVSDTQLAAKLHEFLQASDLKHTTNNIVIKKLESEYGVDLGHKKPFLRHQVDIFLQSQYHFAEEFQIHVQNSGFGGVNDDVLDDQHDDGDGDWSNKGVGRLQVSRKQHKMKNKLCTLSPELQKFLGVPHMTRAQIVKRLWGYVKDKNLQSPQDGKTIICDETLRELFGVDSINILQINKALTNHMWASAKPTRREKPRKHEREEPEEAELYEKRPRKVFSGFLAPLPLTDSLVKFLGTGESSLTRGDVIKRLWEYI